LEKGSSKRFLSKTLPRFRLVSAFLRCRKMNSRKAPLFSIGIPFFSFLSYEGEIPPKSTFLIKVTYSPYVVGMISVSHFKI
jgi:hypothetical protein